jgi:hypothetical protein
VSVASLPFLTTYDPVTSGEGELDPLGLSSIGDRLADQVLPGLRARMSRPRFLTAIAVASEGLIARPWRPEYLSPTLSNYLFDLKRLLTEWMPLAGDRWRKLEGRFSAKLLEYVCLGTGRHHALAAAFGWSAEGQPSVTVVAHDPLEAIVITVHIDRLRHVRFKSCARPDCRKPFALSSRHHRMYCTWYCGHVVSGRNTYRRKRLKQSNRRRR